MYPGMIIILYPMLYAEGTAGTDNFQLLSGEDFLLLDLTNFLLLGF